jgi:ankyrin repeat protein
VKFLRSNQGLYYSIIQLIKHGADVDSLLEDGVKTPLFYAKTAQIALVLVENGADVNHQDPDGKTVLHHNPSFGVAEVLLFHDGNVNIKDNKGRLSHFYLSLPEVFDLFLMFGLDVDSKDNDGETALIYHIHKGFLPMIEVLLASGADVNIRNPLGATAAQICIESDYSESKQIMVLKLLANYGAKFYAKIPIADDSEGKKDAKDSQGDVTILDLAKKLGKEKVIEFINDYSGRTKVNSLYPKN